MTAHKTASLAPPLATAPAVGDGGARAGEARRAGHQDGIAGLALAVLFSIAARAPWVLRLLRPLAVRATVWYSPAVRRNVAANATRIFGRPLLPAERRAFTRRVVGSFYDFVVDLGRTARCSADDLPALVERVDGEPAFLASRASGRGAIMVTAHMGSFEVGLAALRGVERNVHVVFKRDAFAAFERLRSRVRTTLGIHEEPIDDGFPALVRLRDALRADHVVVMQGDRAMPGQRSQVVPFLSGHLRLPVGPVKLALLTGSPLVPVVVVRGGRGRYRVYMAPPIEMSNAESASDGGVELALLAVAKAIEPFVRDHPEQWLMLGPAFVEDEKGELRAE